MSVSRDEMRQRLGVDAVHDGWFDAASRRTFMKLLGASIALAGVEGCTRMPASNILPYTDQPELTPGLPQYYATAMVLDGYATGLLVESHEGRPTKVEGNPDHPASLGAAGVFEQASVLQLYDPDRARQVRHGQARSSWKALSAAFGPAALSAQLGAGGAGLFLLLEPTSSPVEAALLDRVREVYPKASVHFYAPLTATTDALVPHYDFLEADVVVAVDADVLAEGPFHLRYARHFAERRRPESGRGMNRCYAIESSVTVTGAAADHRFAVRPGEIVQVLDELLVALRPESAASSSSVRRPAWIDAIARDLRAHGDRSVVLAGRHLPARAQALALQINQALGSVGRTVWFAPSALIGAGDTSASLTRLVEALGAGEVHTLVCAGGNPAYATAGKYGFESLIRRVPQSLYLGLYENETAHACQWMAPAAHYLESWSDARAYDGTLSVVQPLIEPLGGGKTPAELLSLLAGSPDARAYDLLRETWRRRAGPGADFDHQWRTVLRRGLLDDSAFPRASGAAAVPASSGGSETTGAPSNGGDRIELIFRPHPRVRDGAFANNGWLQELPEPITTVTWGNVAHVSAATARRLQVANGDLVEIRAGARRARLPVVVLPGHADGAATVHFGLGRAGAEALARGVGTNVYPLWPGDAFSLADATMSRVGPATPLAETQPHHTMETTTPARVMTLASRSNGAQAPHPATLTLYRAPASLPDGVAPHQWAMTIDLGACIGCGACTVACQAENNIPVVGREQVLKGREMHWLRIDWYAPRSPAEPLVLSQPMLCQQCEHAPCEYVCPVEATVHSRDGLNEMVYNRCVGTRFCSNNCPYKVRRFNWFDFNAGLSDTERLVKNPDVTVRERGVMEKCTFCVQRIREAEIAARIDGRPLKGSDVRTACQQACPAQAITFGSLDEHDSPMVRGRNSARAYAVLDELGTEPRVRYLTRVRNTNPELERTT